MVSDCYEACRNEYRPPRVRILFVGESRPAGGTFFYKGDSRLARCTHKTFAETCGIDWETVQEFLAFFRSKGCYLDDLCREPVNQLESAVRESKRDAAVPDLAERMRTYQPKAVVCVMRAVKRHVRRAMNEAGLGDLPFYCTPFPREECQEEYRKALREALNDLKRRGTFDCTCGV